MRFYSWRSSRPSLVRVRQPAHARHDTEDVVVDGVQAEEERVRLVGVGTKVARRLRLARARHAVKDKRGVVNAREVARSGRLVVLGLDRKRIDVDRVVETTALTHDIAHSGILQSTLASRLCGSRRRELRLRVILVRSVIGVRRRNTLSAHVQPATRVVLLGLDLPEVVTLTLIKAVLSVELQASLVDDVVLRKGRRRGTPRAIQAVGILDDPDQLLDRVVQRQVNTRRRVRDGLVLVVLELLDEVLVALLGKTTALLRVELDLVNLERRRQVRGGEVNTCRRRALDQVLGIVEDDVEADLVVLEGDERESQARVAVEPELQRDIENTRATDARVGCRCRQRRRVHPVELDRLVRGRCERLPDVEPLTLLAIDDLATDLNLNLLEQEVAKTVLLIVPVRLRIHERVASVADDRKLNLQVRLADQIRIAVDDGNDTLAERRSTREVDTERLHGEVRVTLLEDLPERDMRVARDVDILSPVGNKLKKSTCHGLFEHNKKDFGDCNA